MRLKLVFISAFVAAILGAGSASAIIISATSSLKGLTRPGLLVISSNLLPVLAILFTSIFVYRHTARRRKLQAILTAILAILLTILFFVIASIVTARRQPVQPDSRPPVAPAFRL
jgi:heme/copper-type cytochrome/quinol oxidase subunit 2